MKPLQIGLLIAAGAVGGALVVKLTQRAPEPPAAVAQAPAASTVTTPAPATPIPEPPAPEPAVSTPAPAPVTTPRKKPVPPPAAPVRNEPVTVAQNQPPAVSAPAPTPVTPAPSQPEPVAEPATPPPAPEPAPVPAPPPPPPPTVTLKAGTLLQVRLVEGLSSERNSPGDAFTGTIDQPIVVDGMVIAERGARVEGRVVASDKGGRVKGVSSLAVELVRLHTSDGQKIAIQTDSFERHAESGTGSDVAKVGAVTAIGAAIGAIAGGGKGAAIGAAAGGAAGTGGVMATRGKATTLASETRISFRLRAPVTVTERPR
jgi:hypothetical protein